MIGGNKRRTALTFIYLFLIVYIVFNLLPYAWLIITSFKTRVDAFSIPPKWIFEPTFSNYKEAFLDKGFLLNLRNSLIVTSVSTSLALLIGLPSAYAFSRFRIKGEKAMMYYLLGTRFTPVVALALPLYLVMAKVGLLNSYVGIVIAHITFNLPFVVWMMKGFFDMVPKEIDEAAKVDGCSWFYIFTRYGAAPGEKRPGRNRGVLRCQLLERILYGSDPDRKGDGDHAGGDTGTTDAAGNHLGTDRSRRDRDLGACPHLCHHRAEEHGEGHDHGRRKIGLA